MTSSAVVGSSAIRSRGFKTSAIAIMIRCRWPPESWCGYDAIMRSGSGSCTSRDDLQDARTPKGGRELGVRRQHFVDLVAAGHDRIERGHRLLEDHRHSRAAQLAQTSFARRQHVLAVEQHLSSRGAQRGGQESHRRLRDDRFARARFAHQAHDLACVDAEACTDRRRARDRPRRQRDRQAAHVEDPRALSLIGAHKRLLIRGSSVSRKPSPSMFTASTVSASRMPG